MDIELSAPPFGGANLSNCEREPIHLAGAIQSCGALVSVTATGETVLQASANAEAFLAVGCPLQGLGVRALGGDLWRRVEEFPKTDGVIPYVVRCRLADPGREYNALLHRAAGGEIVIEFERAENCVDPFADLESALRDVTGAQSLEALYALSARVAKDITGYDRVMIYKFDEDGAGEVIAETRKPELEAFLGNRYPASDIPRLARDLYVRNRVRIIADVQSSPSPIEPRLSPLGGKDLDMSFCLLRSASPIHIQYLKNMGVSATLVASLMVGDHLWGLISCHHYTPRRPTFALRSVCELLAEAIGTRIAALESFRRGQCELTARRLSERMAEAVERDGDWRAALLDGARSLLLSLDAAGAALVFEGRVQSIGDAPGDADVRAIAGYLASKFVGGLYATTRLQAEAPELRQSAAFAAGVLGASLSNDGADMLIWFRPERVRTITWGGDPYKSDFRHDDLGDLSPRRSFAQWQQIVEGASTPWTATETAAARLMAACVAEFAAQSRAVSLVAAKTQFDQISRRIRGSDQALVVADAEGRILQCSPVFEEISGAADLKRLEDLSPYFAEPADIALRLKMLPLTRRGWRCDAVFQAGAAQGQRLRMRADAITAADRSVMGFALAFVDVTERQMAKAARRRIQEMLTHRQDRLRAEFGPRGDAKAEALITQVIENAQLAAVEVTDGADSDQMRELLEGIRSAVDRCAQVLERMRLEASSDVEGGR